MSKELTPEERSAIHKEIAAKREELKDTKNMLKELQQDLVSCNLQFQKDIGELMSTLKQTIPQMVGDAPASAPAANDDNEKAHNTNNDGAVDMNNNDSSRNDSIVHNVNDNDTKENENENDAKADENENVISHDDNEMDFC